MANRSLRIHYSHVRGVLLLVTFTHQFPGEAPYRRFEVEGSGAPDWARSGAIAPDLLRTIAVAVLAGRERAGEVAKERLKKVKDDLARTQRKQERDNSVVRIRQPR